MSEGKVKLSLDVLPDTGVPVSQVDVLFVVDDSGSMDPHQQNLANQFPVLVNKLAMNGLDVHVGVVTTSMTASGGGGTGRPEGDGKLVNGFVSSTDPDFVNKLKQNMLVGTQGSGTEMLFAPIMAALSEPLLSGANAGFLRPQAPLMVVFVTDAEDQGTETSADLQAFLTKLKGTGFRTAAAYVSPSFGSSCVSSGEPEPVKLEEFLMATQATKVSLCDPTMGQTIVAAISGMASPSPNPGPKPVYDRVIELPSKAVLSSISVSYDHQALMFGDLYSGWVFDSQRNAVVIGEGVPLGSRPWTTKIEIEYQIANWP